jgi:ribonuclease D
MADKSKVEIVTTPAGLADVCQRLARVGLFAFDTEFVGEDNYEAETCLVQVATDSYCAIIDPLAGLDLTPFWELVADDGIEVIVHAGTEDLAQCFRRVGRPAAKIFDLQIAAGLIGLGYPTSLSRLARITIGAKIHKSQTLTDWRTRPLTQEQIDYAAEDVVHLPAMFRFIGSRLDELGRREWAAVECDRACQSATSNAQGEQKLRRLRGAGGLSRKELAIADALLEEREKLARHYNRPPRAVLRDHLLVEMARRGWTDVQRIRSLRGLNLSTSGVKRLAEVIGRARQLPEECLPQPTNDEDTPSEEVLLLLTSAVLRDYCRHNDLAYTLLASKQDLRAVIRSHTRSAEPGIPTQLRTGWRRTAVGDLLDQILSGQSTIRVKAEGGERRLTTE